MKGLHKTKYKKFNYYLRQCRDCDELFKCDSKKGKYCDPCKENRILTRLNSSYKARKIIIREGFKMIDKLIDNLNNQKEVKDERKSMAI